MKTNPLFSTSFDGQIWRIFPDEANNFLVLEIRNYERRAVSFAALDMNKLEILWQNFQLAEPWWVGIEAVKNGSIYFHGYNHIQYSNHLGLSCLSIQQKKMLWERKDLIFKAINGEKLFAQHTKQLLSGQFSEIDVSTGEIQSENATIESGENQKPEAVLYPMLFDAIDASFHKIALFIEKKLNEKVLNSVEYLEYNERIMISFYTNHNNKLQNRLVLFDSDVKILQNWILDENLDGVGKQTFLIFNHQIIFVTHKINLNVYEL